MVNLMKKKTTTPTAEQAALYQLINSIPDPANKCPLPLGQPDFAKCSRAIAEFANADEPSLPLPFPSVMLPPPL